MKEMIQLADYAAHIQEMLPKGFLLNTMGDKFNAMIIAWGSLGRTWNVPTFTVYVREHRYTKAQIDATGEFTVSIPLEKADPTIFKVCGTQSGREIDKVTEAHLTLEDPEVIHTPGIKEYPITLECKVLYAQPQDLSLLPTKIQEELYPQDVDGSYFRANQDAHTTYVGEIVSAYKIL